MNTNKMKATFAGLLVAASANAMATPIAERMCLALGKIAEVVSVGMHKGVAEDDAITTLAGGNTRTDANIVTIIQYVYTTRFDPKTARNMVYLKCTAGEYL